MRTYLDTNVYEYLIKDHADNALLEQLKKDNIYISTAHIEELKNAIEGSHTLSDLQSNDSRIQLMKALSIQKIISPHYNSLKATSTNQYRSIDDCIQAVYDYDTAKRMEDIQDAKRIKQKKDLQKLRDQNKEARFFSNKTAEEIWKIPDVQDELHKFPQHLATYNDRAIKSLRTVPKYDLAFRQNRNCFQKTMVKNRKFVLSPGCFPIIAKEYPLLECVLEFLVNCLDNVGYNTDTTSRTTHSAPYDIQHLILATYCERFVTRDKRLHRKAQAIYQYIGAPIKVLDTKAYFEELSSSI